MRQPWAISSLTGYLDLEQEYLTNGSASSHAGSFFVVQGGYARKDFTQEFRVTSDFDGPLNFLLGGYYFNEKVDQQSAIKFGNQAVEHGDRR